MSFVDFYLNKMNIICFIKTSYEFVIVTRIDSNTIYSARGVGLVRRQRLAVSPRDVPLQNPLSPGFVPLGKKHRDRERRRDLKRKKLASNS